MTQHNHPVLGAFDAAFLINADAEHARLKTASEELARIGIPFERFPAITLCGQASPLPVGAMGATLSHCAIVKLAKERNLKNVLIFEDDVIFRADFAHWWGHLASTVQVLSYDLFYFYDWQAKQTDHVPQCVKIAGTLCAHAYAVARPYYDTFLKAVLENLSTKAIDRTLLLTRAEKWAIVPNLIGQNAGKSTICNENRKRRWSSRDG